MEDESLDSMVADVVDDDMPWDDDDSPSMTVDATYDQENKKDEVAETVLGEIDLGKDRFSALMNVFQILKQPCKDLDIKESYIRQISSDRACIFDIDIDPIFIKDGKTPSHSVNIPIGGLAQKHDLLEPFRKQNSDVKIELSEKYFVFKDTRSKISFSYPISEYMECKYLTEADTKDRLQVTDKYVFKIKIDKNMLDRLSTYSKSMNATVIKADFKGDKAIFKITAADVSSGTVVSLLTLGDEELVSDDIVGSMTFPIEPFTSCMAGGITELNMELIYRKVANSFMMKISSEININDTNDKIPVVVWFQSSLKD